MNTNIRIIFIALMICALGIFSIYSSNFRKEGELWQMIYQKQILWVIIGLVCYLFFSKFNYRRFWDFTYFLYGFIVVLLGLVFLLGIIRLGAQRWLNIGGFNLQPSELAKLIMVIFVARYYSRKSADDIALKAAKYGIFKALILPSIFVLIPVVLIVEQPDLGSGSVVFLIFMAILFTSNVKLRYIIIVISMLCLAVPIGWNFLRDYQKERVLVFLNPNIDPLGSGYTIIQSKIAVGSGGLLGKGWLSGTQSQLHFLPESHTDFIFATFTEERGFIGGFLLMLLYFILIKDGFNIAYRTKDHFGKLLALGIALMLCIQTTINMAMNMGLFPVVGIPLPLMSYGGSSVLVTFIALGILANINKTRAVF